MIDLERIKELHAASTQLEWEAGDVWVYTLPVYPDDRRLSNVLGMKFEDEDRADSERARGLANAEFIAAARSDIPRLVAALEAVLAMELNGDGQGYDTALERVHETVERALKEEQCTTN